MSQNGGLSYFHHIMAACAAINAFLVYMYSKPLAAFPHNYCRNNGQREKYEVLLQRLSSSQVERKMDKLGIQSMTLVFNPFQNKPWFLHACSTSLLKTLGKGEIAHNEQFLLFPQCFLSFWRTFWHSHLI